MRRVSIVGSTGSGKSTLARAVGAALTLPVLELDSVYHQAGWQPLADPEFRARVRDFTAAEAWVVDGNYTSHGVADIVWPRADTLLWLDLPRRVVMTRVVRRTLRRVVRREELWNGNREPWTNLYSTDPERNVVVWAWTRFDSTRSKYEAKTTDGTWSHLDVHRLRSGRAVDGFVSSL